MNDSYKVFGLTPDDTLVEVNIKRELQKEQCIKMHAQQEIVALDNAYRAIASERANNKVKSSIDSFCIESQIFAIYGKYVNFCKDLTELQKATPDRGCFVDSLRRIFNERAYKLLMAIKDLKNARSLERVNEIKNRIKEDSMAFLENFDEEFQRLVYEDLAVGLGHTQEMTDLIRAVWGSISLYDLVETLNENMKTLEKAVMLSEAMAHENADIAPLTHDEVALDNVSDDINKAVSGEVESNMMTMRDYKDAFKDNRISDIQIQAYNKYGVRYEQLPGGNVEQFVWRSVPSDYDAKLAMEEKGTETFLATINNAELQGTRLYNNFLNSLVEGIVSYVGSTSKRYIDFQNGKCKKNAFVRERMVDEVKLLKAIYDAFNGVRNLCVYQGVDMQQFFSSFDTAKTTHEKLMIVLENAPLIVRFCQLNDAFYKESKVITALEHNSFDHEYVSEATYGMDDITLSIREYNMEHPEAAYSMQGVLENYGGEVFDSRVIEIMENHNLDTKRLKDGINLAEKPKA